jgi:hypothetical protein
MMNPLTMTGHYNNLHSKRLTKDKGEKIEEGTMSALQKIAIILPDQGTDQVSPASLFCSELRSCLKCKIKRQKAASAITLHKRKPALSEVDPETTDIAQGIKALPMPVAVAMVPIVVPEY